MPTYEYECKKCGNTFDVFQSMSDPPVKTCPTCAGSVRRIINGGTGVIFKGSGFYVNDSKGSRTSASGSSSDAKAKSGTDASKGGEAAKDAASDAAKNAHSDAMKSSQSDTKGKDQPKSEKVSEKAPS